MECQKSGGHKELEFVKGRSKSLYLLRFQGRWSEGGKGRTKGGGQQELQMSGWFLLGNLKLVFNKRGRVLMRTLLLRDKISRKKSQCIRNTRKCLGREMLELCEHFLWVVTSLAFCTV